MKITNLTPTQVRQAAQLGADTTKTTATFAGQPGEVVALVRDAYRRLPHGSARDAQNLWGIIRRVEKAARQAGWTPQPTP